MVAKLRQQRVSERIREELSMILILKSRDPRLAGVTVTDVTVDRELEYANIYVSALEGSERAKEVLDGFHHAQGFLRSELARRIELRVFPRLRFYWDPTSERADHIERIMESLHTGEQPGSPPDNNRKDELMSPTSEAENKDG